ncbi:amidohydrolase [Candidatus Woesearchaeota archaeon]|nr:amidohydrolase [Candidatus Woesearchaeota archaeon]
MDPDWLVNIRRDLHMYPELSGKEFRTTEKIAEILLNLGLNVTKGIIGEGDKKVGVVGLLKGNRSGKTLALRADIDALPISEKEKEGNNYASRNKKVMHACGHDVHTAIMLGVAKNIVENDGGLEGNIKFIFQPAEEEGWGAKKMISAGVLENPYVTALLACHVYPALHVGEVGIHEKEASASVTGFKISLEGEGGHVASSNTRSSVILAQANLITLLDSTVNSSPIEEHAMLCIGKISGAEIINVVPDALNIYGTIRYFREGSRIKRQIKDVCREIKNRFQLKSCKADYTDELPACINNPEISKFMRETAINVVGSKNVRILQPWMGGEDFAYFANERPSSIILLGCSDPEKRIEQDLHSSNFEVDERVLKVGVDIFYKAVLDYLCRKN